MQVIKTLLLTVSDVIMCPMTSSTHYAVIPALEPVVFDLFIYRSSSSKTSDPEVSAQREVLQFTILKLLHHPQV